MTADRPSHFLCAQFHDFGIIQRLTINQQTDSQYDMFKEIYDNIVDDNRKSGINASTLSRHSSPTRHENGDASSRITLRPASVPNNSPTPSVSSTSPARRHDGDELFLPSSQISPVRNGTRQSLPQASQQPPPPPQLQQQTALKLRPQVQPKPKELEDLSRKSGGASVTVTIAPNNNANRLAERFSRIQIPRKPQGRDQNHTGSPLSSTDTSSPLATTPTSSITSTSKSRASPIAERPSGPREMPNSSIMSPPPPPKIPLDAPPNPSLPRAPSPAYDPSKGGQSQSHYGETTNGASSQRWSNGSDNLRLIKTASERSPTYISAEDLYGLTKKYNVLLIDVRSREEFDYGHVNASSIMCIEPVSLRTGISAEELEERLVVSPHSELTLFERRNEFDYVVYYDQGTTSDQFLRGAPTNKVAFALRLLHDTLHEFNYYKQLRRPPIMLLGGLDAWIDIFGPHSLVKSRTAAQLGSTRPRTPVQRPGRPIGRVPMASVNSSLEVRKRRLRGQIPLNADEERSWLEKAHKEGVDTADFQHAQSDSDAESQQVRPEEPISPLVYSYEGFLRKASEGSTARQSMMVAIPPPPARPAPSLPSLPSIPSRPAPAVPRPSYSGVSERESSPLTPVSRQATLPRTPLYHSRAMTQYLKLPKTGLHNFSVTCYMNATIQCLVGTIPLSQFFLDNRWRDFVQKNWKGSNGIMPEIYGNLVRSLWRGDADVIRPASLRKFCARLNPEWGVDRQQDAKEFFDFLVDCLHEDLNTNWERQQLRPLTEKDELRRESLPVRKASKIEWERYSHRESSFISELFAGQHASRLRCTTCQNTSTTYEAFYSISVEIPQSGRGADIHDCLRSYCREEKLSGDEVWKCPHCKCEREATKRITITRAPQFLVVHFKRFSMSKNESARKVHTPIHFPLHGLDMEQYIVPPLPQKQENLPDDRPIDPAITPPYLYDAYAVMRHLGSSGAGGHYISLVKDSARGRWRKFDDDRYSDFEPKKLKKEQALQNGEAYLVFYGRCAPR